MFRIKSVCVRHFLTMYRIIKRDYHKEHNDKLLKYLQAKIKFSGPITIHEYMKEILINPLSGYYMQDDVIGKEGDFITSPEISQIFGELMGIWIYNEWQKMGAPRPFKLIELGPGTGSLSQDVLRTLKQLKLGKSDLELHFIEKSLAMSSLQEKRFCPSSAEQETKVPNELSSTYKLRYTENGIPVNWHYHFSDIPHGFSMIYAHEFFDAMPIHKLKKTEHGWREVLVDMGSGDELRYVLSRESTPASKLYVNVAPSDELEELEVSPDSGLLIGEISARIEENGGSALIIDYGEDRPQGDTFRAFSQHKQVSPLLSPGHADLTADVDFSLIRKRAEDKLLTYGPVSQAAFLKEMGIGLRLKKLLESARSQSERETLVKSYEMLTDERQMGQKFKVMALLPKVMKPLLEKHPPVGFISTLN